MSHHIKPSSVDSYLSGICYELQSVFPDVRTVRRDPLVVRTLTGCKRLAALYNTPVRREAPLTVAHLQRAVAHFPPTSHDNRLFVSLFVSGFLALHRLGELVSPDNADLRTWRKVILRSSTFLSADRYGVHILCAFRFIAAALSRPVAAVARLPVPTLCLHPLQPPRVLLGAASC